MGVLAILVPAANAQSDPCSQYGDDEEALEAAKANKSFSTEIQGGGGWRVTEQMDPQLNANKFDRFGRRWDRTHDTGAPVPGEYDFVDYYSGPNGSTQSTPWPSDTPMLSTKELGAEFLRKRETYAGYAVGSTGVFFQSFYYGTSSHSTFEVSDPPAQGPPISTGRVWVVTFEGALNPSLVGAARYSFEQNARFGYLLAEGNASGVIGATAAVSHSFNALNWNAVCDFRIEPGAVYEGFSSLVGPSTPDEILAAAFLASLPRLVGSYTGQPALVSASIAALDAALESGDGGKWIGATNSAERLGEYFGDDFLCDVHNVAGLQDINASFFLRVGSEASSACALKSTWCPDTPLEEGKWPLPFLEAVDWGEYEDGALSYLLGAFDVWLVWVSLAATIDDFFDTVEDPHEAKVIASAEAVVRQKLELFGTPVTGQ